WQDALNLRQRQKIADNLPAVSRQDRLVDTLAEHGDGQEPALGNQSGMFQSEVFRAVLDEVYLPVQIVFEIILAYVELENKGLSGPARNKCRIQPLDGGDQGIVTIVQAAVGIDSGSDGHEAGIERYALAGFRSNSQPGQPGRAIGHGLNFAGQDVRAFFDRFTQQKPIEACGSPAPPAG